MQNAVLGTVLVVFSAKTLLTGAFNMPEKYDKTGCGDIVSGVIKTYHGVLGLILALLIYMGVFREVYAFTPMILYVGSLYIFGQKVSEKSKEVQKPKKSVKKFARNINKR